MSTQMISDLARAQQAFAAGDLGLARRLAEALIGRSPTYAPAHQIAAIVARREGRVDDARHHFETAARSAPRDPHILNSYGNLLTDVGDDEGARDLYRRALENAPNHLQALVNLALAEKRLGVPEASRDLLEKAITIGPRHAAAWQALGVLRLDQGEPEGAAAALDEALALKPDDLRTLKARGFAELERGGDPAPYYSRARQMAPKDPELALAEAVALQRAGEVPVAVQRLEQLASEHAGYEPVLAAFARLRSQAGEPDGLTRTYEQALAARPADPGIWNGYLATLLRAGRPRDVLERLDRARPALGAAATRLEAVAAAEAGEAERAERAFAALPLAGDVELELAWLRHLLRTGRPEAAATAAEPIVARPNGHGAWPYLAIAWRMTDEARWAWLEGDPSFIRTFDLPIDAHGLAALADALRRLHRARAAPVDQTLRGGTQTEGNLFAHQEPEIRRLKDLLAQAVREYLDGLPERDARHPLLREPREGFRFAGAWSVRLSAAGFHINHVHTTHWISSAFYVVTPEEVGRSNGDASGWLTFGEPPAELGLDLPPFRLVQPQPGRVALFPSTLWHGTRPFGAGERLTVAFDVATAG